MSTYCPASETIAAASSFERLPYRPTQPEPLCQQTTTESVRQRLTDANPPLAAAFQATQTVQSLKPAPILGR